MQSLVTHPARLNRASSSLGRIASGFCLAVVAVGVAMCIAPATALTLPFDALWQKALAAAGLSGNVSALNSDQIAYFCGYALMAASLLAYAVARKCGGVGRNVAGFTDAVAVFAALFLLDPYLSLARDFSFVNRWWPFYSFAAFFAVLLGANQSRAWRLVQLVLVCIGVQALYAVAFYALHINQFQGARFGARTGGTFGSPNPLYPLCLMAIPLALNLSRAPASPEWRWMLRAIVALGTLALLLTFTRGAWLGLAAIAIYFVNAYGSSVPNFSLWRKVAFASVGVILLGVLLIRTHGKMMGTYADSSFWGRLYIWQVAARAVADKPVWGSGINTYAMQQRHFMTPRLEKFRPANIEAKSLYLNVATELGIVGLGLLLWSGWQFFGAAKRRVQQLEPRADAIIAGTLAALVGLGVAGLFDTPFLNSDRIPPTLALAVLLAAGCIALSAPREANEQLRDETAPPQDAGDMAAFADCARANWILQGALNELDALLREQKIEYWVIGSCARLATMNRPARRVSDIDLIVPDKRALQRVAPALAALGQRHGLFVDASLSRVFRITGEGYALSYGPLSYPLPHLLMQARRVSWGAAQFSTLPPQTLLHTFGLVAEPLRVQDRKSAREFARFLKGHREFDGQLFEAFHAFWRAHWRYFPLKPAQYWWRQRIKAMPRGARQFLLRRVYPTPPVRAIRNVLTFLETRICLAPRDAPERRDFAPRRAAESHRLQADEPKSHKSGFSLPEILIVVAILGLLAALLFPAISNARQRAHQTTCASTLRQFGLAFTMYAQDFDGRLPNPGGRGMQAGGGQAAVTGGENGAVWCAYGAGKGLFAYLERQTDQSNNHWSCPNALPFAPSWEDTQYNVGQTYSMNDYLRARYPGQSVVGEGDVPGEFNPGFHTGVRLDEIASASQIILLFEGVEHPRGGAKRNGSPYVGVYPSRYGSDDLPRNVPEEYHFGQSNFLFCDGHVKALRPTQTWTAATQVKVEKLNYNYAHARGGRVGTGALDLWNPQTSGVVYP